MLTAYLKLVRFPNLVIIALTQYFLRYALITNYGIPHALSDFQFSLLVLATVLIAAGGYAINDYFDVRVDQINRHDEMVVDVHIKRRVAMALHFAFSGAGILIAVFLAYKVEMLKLAIIQFGCGGLLWFYSTHFKKQFLTGNIIIGFLTSLTVLIVGIYEIVPALTPEAVNSSRGLFLIITGYSIFAFISTLIREIIKDLEDLKGDRQMGYNTLAISFGERKARSIAILLSLVMLLLIIIISYKLFKDAVPQLIYITAAIILPLLYLVYVLSYANEKQNYSRASNLMKLLMLTGMFSMLAFQLLEKYV